MFIRNVLLIALVISAQPTHAQSGMRTDYYACEAYVREAGSSTYYYSELKGLDRPTSGLPGGFWHGERTVTQNWHAYLRERNIAYSKSDSHACGVYSHESLVNAQANYQKHVASRSRYNRTVKLPYVPKP